MNAPKQPQELLDKWGIDIDGDTLVLALTHRSFAHENGYIPTNERLEFLGDAVLQIIVTEYLYRHNPDVEEGDLAKMRSATVSQTPLAQAARQIDLGQYLLLGVGESHAGGADKDSILSDTFEALIGATYLCNGLEPTRKVVEKHLAKLLTAAPQRAGDVDAKTSLQELSQELGLGNPAYEVEGFGPDHARHFTAQVVFSGKSYGTGEGTSKKAAEQAAAEAALGKLRHAGTA